MLLYDECGTFVCQGLWFYSGSNLCSEYLGLVSFWFYSEFPSLEPGFLYKIKDPDFQGELARGLLYMIDFTYYSMFNPILIIMYILIQLYIG